MSTSDIKKYGRGNLIAAVFFLIFGIVYEHFSHGVYSGFMMYAFLIPLLAGALPMFLLGHFRKNPPRLCLQLYEYGLAALTVGSVVTGVLEIYGTTNKLVFIYWIAGAAFIAAAGLLFGKKYI